MELFAVEDEETANRGLDRRNGSAGPQIGDECVDGFTCFWSERSDVCKRGKLLVRARLVDYRTAIGVPDQYDWVVPHFDGPMGHRNIVFKRLRGVLHDLQPESVLR